MCHLIFISYEISLCFPFPHTGCLLLRSTLIPFLPTAIRIHIVGTVISFTIYDNTHWLSYPYQKKLYAFHTSCIISYAFSLFSYDISYCLFLTSYMDGLLRCLDFLQHRYAYADLSLSLMNSVCSCSFPRLGMGEL